MQYKVLYILLKSSTYFYKCQIISILKCNFFF